MAPNNFEFDFEQICFNQFKSPDGKIFQDDKDPVFSNYFISKMTYINEPDVKKTNI